MGKRIFLAIFAGLAVVGLVMMLTGFALGGRMGSVQVRDGHWVFENGIEEVTLGKAPAWAHDFDRFYLYGGFTRASISGSHAVDHSAASGGFVQGNLPAAADALHEVDIDISAGYVIVLSGDAPDVVIDGPLRVDSYYDAESGSWQIESVFNGDIRADYFGNQLRYLFGGEDMTTTYTITLPKNLQSLTVNIGMGNAQVQDFTLQEADFEAGMGLVEAFDISATDATFSAAMGGVTVNGFTGSVCALSADMGSVEFWGTVSDELDINCSMGSVNAHLPRPAGYSYDVDVGMGSVTIDGQKRSGSSDSSALPYFDIDCGMGTVDIAFTER